MKTKSRVTMTQKPKSSKSSKSTKLNSSRSLKKTIRSIVLGLMILLGVAGTAIAVVLSNQSQDLRNQASTGSCEEKGMIYCGGCINNCRSYKYTCNEWIDIECQQEGCGGEGVYPKQGESCCPGLTQCSNGRCGKSCGTQDGGGPLNPSVPGCKKSSDCGSNHFCVSDRQGGTMCTPKLGLGKRCNNPQAVAGTTVHDQCQSKNCLNGICAPTTANAKCSPAGAEGDADCAEDYHCSTNGFCVKDAGVGKTCFRESMCLPSLTCSGNQKCVAPSQAQPCSPKGAGGDAMCQIDQFCDAYEKCMPDLVVGNACDRHSQCKSGLYCIGKDQQKKCTLLNKRGAGCTTDSQCDVGLSCQNNICDDAAFSQYNCSDVRRCTKSNQYCKKGYSETGLFFGTCTMKLKNGEVCTAAQECLSGKCVANAAKVKTCKSVYQGNE